jgi:dCTP deaminase
MGILSDRQIRLLAQNGMISDFYPEKKQQGISHGISSFGYDARLADKIFLFKSKNHVIDPKNFDKECYEEIIGEKFIIPPHGFALGKTIEKFKIPRDILVICLGKSTYARCGLIVNVTPLEPGWEGFVTLEFSNTTNLPIILYANEGVCQFIFLKGDEECEKPYDKGGKYMNQEDITLPFVKE